MKRNSLLAEILRWQKIGPMPISIQTKDPKITSHRETFLPQQRKYIGGDERIYFTMRETQIAELILNHQHTYKGIAVALKISPRTVEYYIQSMRHKLEVPNKIILRKRLFELRELGEF